MATPSINIGICNIGKVLIQSIDTHFKLHETNLSDSILSSTVTLKDGEYCFEMIKSDVFEEEDVDNMKSWFGNFLYPEINSLESVSVGSSDSITLLNIILQIEETKVTDILKDLLNSIQELKNEELLGDLSIRLFVVINPSNKKNSNSNKIISKQLIVLKQLIEDFDTILHDVYYIDNQNIDNFHLNIETKWLGFALSEFFVLKMIGPTSMAETNKNKIFGLGVVHFNEVLFREIISNKILAYKFEEEGINDTSGVQLQDIYDKCNPFIKKYQDFFQKFFEKYPFSKENDESIENNSRDYILEFKNSLNGFVTDEQHKIGESKAILANLIGEDDDTLEGVDWKGERLSLKDLEFDIVNYFNQYVDEEDSVNLSKEKDLREKITDLKNGIKKDQRLIKSIDEKSDDIHSDLNISFEEGVFSIDGKRVNASGYIPSKIGPDDEFYSFKDKPIPEQMDLSPYFNSVKDQGQLGSCTAFSVAAVYEFAAIRNNKKVDISELFIYYNSRVVRGNVNEDTGVSFLDAINSVKEHGACLSDSYPYNVEKFNITPNDNAFVEAKHQVVEKAFRVQVNEQDFKQVVASGHPVIFGLKLFESFYPNNKSGLIPYPSPMEATYENHGYHAMLIVGYNDEEKLFKVRNSWGKSFAENGYCYIPYDYVINPVFCPEAFVITEIVDLSYSEFKYDTSASFTFLKDALIRKKNITEYRLRERIKVLSELKMEYDITVLQNEENTEQIKDSIFRKNILRKLEAKTPDLPKDEATSIFPEPKPKPKSLKRWYTLIIVGAITLFLSIILNFLITFIGSLIFGTIGLGILGFALWKIIQAFYKKDKNSTSGPINVPEPFQSIATKDLYAFRVADRLFDLFDALDKDLITRYRALSKYYNKVKNWKKENTISLNSVDFDSPKFVVNVVEKKPLMDYLSNKKDYFLKRLPHLSAIFHKKYETETNNLDEVFSELKNNYLLDIQNNIDTVLDVSMVDYLLGKKYPYFNDAPNLNEIIPKLDRVSRPFCNLKASSTDIHTQHYVLFEKITSNRNHKLNELAVHRNADITPVIVEREGQSKKYVSIQVAAIESIENLVRFSKE